MSTILDLGKLVKAKYPGQYDDLSDYEVGQKVKTKYPTQYNDFTDAPAPKSESQKQEPKQSTYQQNRGVAQKAAGFLGIEKAGQGLATASRVATGAINQTGNESGQALTDSLKLIEAARKYPVGSPQRTRLLKAAQGLPAPVTQEEIDPGTALSNKEVAGSFANVALNVATPSAFKGGAAAQVAKNTALGAGYGAAGGLNDNKSGKDLAESTLTGALIGGAIPVAGKVLGKAKQAITQTLPENLYNRAVKPTLDELRKNVRFGTDTLGKELLQEGVKGGPEKLLKIADSRLNQYENELQTVLQGSKATISRDALSKYLEPLIKKVGQTPGLGDDVAIIAKVLGEFPQEVPLATANKIKRNIYNEIRNVGYKLDANLSTKREAMKALASGIKTEIEKSVGGTRVADINKKLSVYGRLEDRVVDLLARNNRNNLFSLTDAILTGGGLAAGSPLGFAAALARHGIGSIRGLTTTAVGLNKLNKVGTGVVARTVKQGVKRAILNAN